MEKPREDGDSKCREHQAKGGSFVVVVVVLKTLACSEN